MESKPPKPRGVEIQSLIGEKEDNRLPAGPFVEKIVVKNHNWPKCVVIVELTTRAAGIRINGKKSWKSSELHLGGGADKLGKRSAAAEPELTLTPHRGGGQQLLIIKVKWRRDAVKKFTQVCELRYPLWIQ